jgi:hypothetical protein
LKDGFATHDYKKKKKLQRGLINADPRFKTYGAKHVNFKSICISFGKIYEGLNMFWQNA